MVGRSIRLHRHICAAQRLTRALLRPSSDDIGAASIGAYGGHKTTPSIDEMAAAGRRYNYAYSMPACAPTR